MRHRLIPSTSPENQRKKISSLAVLYAIRRTALTMIRRPGRPPKATRDEIITAIQKRKVDIIQEDGKLLSKTSPVWEAISADLDNRIAGRTIYSLLCEKNFREEAIGLPSKNPADVKDSSFEQNLGASIDDLDASNSEMLTSFTIFADKDEFKKLCEEKIYIRRENARRKVYDRRCIVLKPGLWQQWITNEIWRETRMKCAFNFRKHSVTQDAMRGTMNGTCSCGSKIDCKIDNSGERNVKIRCTVQKGTGVCGKRYLRDPIRDQLGAELCHKSAVIWRTETADHLMSPGDIEPPHLYKSSVLRVAKNEHVMRQFLDPDPLRALDIMMMTSMKATFHNIGLNPFVLHYWTNHQLHVYRSYAKRCPASVCIDATGSIVRRIERCDGSKSKHIFLYICVVNDQGSQYSVAQMLSESHNTNTIMYWLSEWARSGAPHPREVICDSSKALLAGVIKAFTDYSTIEQYANSFSTDGQQFPSCHVRIDVAHFLHMYANFLKSTPGLVRTLLLGAMGQLILARDIQSAENTLRSLLIISRCQTNGDLASGEPSSCDVHYTRLKGMLNPNTPDVDVTDNEHTNKPEYPSSPSIFDDSCDSSTWKGWVSLLDDEAKKIAASEKGDRVNAHYLPKFADRLVNDVRWLPLWGNLFYAHFQHGRVPASSAPVESEFNIIKSHLLKNADTPIRVDDFAEKHVTGLINGRTKLADASNSSSAVPTMNAPSDVSVINERPVHMDVSVNESNRLATDVSEQNLIFKTQNTDLINVQTKKGDAWNSSVALPTMNAPGDASVMDERVSDRDESTPLAIDVSEQNDISDTQDPVSKTEDFVVQSYMCAICFVPIEALKKHDTTEHKDEQLLCSECLSDSSAPKIFAAREAEDWRGLTSKSAVTKRSRYLHKSHQTYDAIAHRKLTKIPIMKNGHSLKVQAVKFGKDEYSFSNTCGFDSIMTLLLVAACDYPEVEKELISMENDVPLFGLILSIMQKGLRAHTYRQRAVILKANFEDAIKQKTENCYLVDCRVNVGSLIGKILRNSPSVEEISLCNGGCSPRQKQLRIIALQRQGLHVKNFKSVLSEQVALKGSRKCCRKGCSGLESTSFSKTGPFIFIELDDGTNLSLKQIPKHFDDPLGSGSKQYSLIGICRFQGPTMRTRLSGDDKMSDPLGHYTALALRPPGTWIEYDDTEDNEKPHSQTFQTQAHLLIYAKVAVT